MPFEIQFNGCKIKKDIENIEIKIIDLSACALFLFFPLDIVNLASFIDFNTTGSRLPGEICLYREMNSNNLVLFLYMAVVGVVLVLLFFFIAIAGRASKKIIIY